MMLLGGHKLDDTNSSRSQVSPAAAPQLSVDSISPISLAHSPKDYVDSLHQNNKETLIYGKNNVKVQPVSCKFYCHLLIPRKLYIKWTHFSSCLKLNGKGVLVE